MSQDTDLRGARCSAFRAATIQRRHGLNCPAAAYDVKASLRRIHGLRQALLEDSADRLDDRARNYLAHIEKEAQQIGRLVDDLLALMQVSRAEPAPETVDVSFLAEQSCRDTVEA